MWPMCRIRWKICETPDKNRRCLVVVEHTLLNKQRTAVTILGNRMNAAVQKALGGGWQATDLPTPDDLARRRDLPQGPDTTSTITSANHPPT
jgi:hypothetical protein